jgi:hypothetical protein
LYRIWSAENERPEFSRQEYPLAVKRMSVHRPIATKDGVSIFAIQMATAMNERTRPVPAGHLALSGTFTHASLANRGTGSPDSSKATFVRWSTLRMSPTSMDLSRVSLAFQPAQ